MGGFRSDAIPRSPNPGFSARTISRRSREATPPRPETAFLLPLKAGRMTLRSKAPAAGSIYALSIDPRGWRLFPGRSSFDRKSIGERISQCKSAGGLLNGSDGLIFQPISSYEDLPHLPDAIHRRHPALLSAGRSGARRTS